MVANLKAIANMNNFQLVRPEKMVVAEMGVVLITESQRQAGFALTLPLLKHVFFGTTPTI